MHTFQRCCDCQSTHRTVFLGADSFITFLSNEAIWLMPHPLPNSRSTLRLKE